MKLRTYAVAITLILSVVLGGCSKDDHPLSSPNARLSAITEHMTFSPSVRTSGKFHPRFYIVDEQGKKSELLSGVNFFFLRKYVSETLQGARTVVFVKSSSSFVGKWVTPVLKQEKGTASANSLQICIIDIANPSRKLVMTASSYPGSTSKNGTTIIDGEKIRGQGQYSAGLMLNVLLDKLID